jgi:hypothetical protein
MLLVEPRLGDLAMPGLWLELRARDLTLEDSEAIVVRLGRGRWVVEGGLLLSSAVIATPMAMGSTPSSSTPVDARRAGVAKGSSWPSI